MDFWLDCVLVKSLEWQMSLANEQAIFEVNAEVIWPLADTVWHLEKKNACYASEQQEVRLIDVQSGRHMLEQMHFSNDQANANTA